MSKAIGFGVLGVLGVVVCIIGASVFLLLFPEIVKKKINEELPLKNGSDAYKRWQKFAVPIQMKFTIFHLKNHENYHNLSDLILEERGPYVFDEKRVKTNIKYSKNKSLVSYEEHKVYKFNEKSSKGLSLSDTVTFINLPVLGIIFNKVNPAGSLAFTGFQKFLSENEKSLFTNRTVGQLLFDGFNLTLFEEIESNHLFNKDDGIELGPFSISDGGNDKLEEPWTIHTGIDSMDKYGQIYQFDNRSTLINNDKRHTMIWKYHDQNATTCNALKGTDGTMFKPSVSKKDVLYVFEPQLCRSVFFHFGQETSVRDIDTYRFWVPKEYFQSPNANPENSCYCPEKNTTECTTNGLLDISNCLRMSKGAPVIMSAPYFHNGDKELRAKINLKSEKEINDHNYGTFLDIEPMTGTVLRATRRIQINVEVKQFSLIPQLSKIAKDDKYVVPVLWLEETEEANEKQADEVKSMVSKKLGIYISIAVIVVGALKTITAIALYIRGKRVKFTLTPPTPPTPQTPPTLARASQGAVDPHNGLELSVRRGGSRAAGAVAPPNGLQLSESQGRGRVEPYKPR